MMTNPILTHLETLIAQRRDTLPEGSYTTYLFTEGQDKILKKIGEEAAETIIASKNGSRDELIYEASDLIYHLLVLLAHHHIPLAALETELERRHLDPGSAGL
ncbi:MAG: phosphoribosyl-ATP diphosphatase [Geodermatophilaceae bacterium]|nr:phosphoribosyl-ATP diphosphatase [Geodermatophilaceae bacterium]